MNDMYISFAADYDVCDVSTFLDCLIPLTCKQPLNQLTYMYTLNKYAIYQIRSYVYINHSDFAILYEYNSVSYVSLDETGILEECGDWDCPDQCDKISYSAELSYSALSGTSLQHELSSKEGTGGQVTNTTHTSTCSSHLVLIIHTNMRP